MSKNKKIVLAVVVLLVLVAAAVFSWFHWGPPAQKKAALESRAMSAEAVPDASSEGEIGIVFTVMHGDQAMVEFQIRTTALTLREALEQEGLISGSEGEYGLYVLTVDGETADESQQQWWCLTQDGEMLPTGVDDTVLVDGGHYEFILTTGWDVFPEATISITLTVVHGDGTEAVFPIETSALTLRDALEQEERISGTESEYGLYVLTVDGETADESRQQWWCLTIDGQMSATGVDDTVLQDGADYVFTLTTGW